MSTKQLLCRYYAQGVCNYGDHCFYSHDPHNAIVIPEDVCLFYLRSSCIHGDTCAKTHKSISELLDGVSFSEVEDDLDYTALYEEANDEDSASLFVSNNTFDRIVSVENNHIINRPTSTLTNDETIRSYASVASSSHPKEEEEETDLFSKELCTFYEQNGFCVTPKCRNVHGIYCDMCGFYSLHPFNEIKREQHKQECIREHEKNMEESFAYQRSKDLTCGICLDVVMDKESRKTSRFGILENCLHVYCIECIRTWRNSNFDKKNKRGCPQCRIKSDFVIPSEYFYEDKEEKGKLINEYKDALSKQHCKYFKQGQGKCPFEGACFYKHEFPDGRKADLPMPADRRRVKGTNGQVEDYASLLSLFLDMDSIRQILADNEFDLGEYDDILFADQ